MYSFLFITEADHSLYTVACLSDWTHKIGVAGLTAVNAFLVENYNTDDAHQQYTEWVLEEIWFLWMDNEPMVCY